MATTLKPSKFQSGSPKQRLEFERTKFFGIDNSNDAASLGDDYSPDSLNTTLDLQGSVTSRKGYTKLITTAGANATLGGYSYYKSDGTKQLVFGQGAGLYRYNNAGGQVAISTSYTSGQQWDFDEYNDLMYAANGTDNLQQYNGSTVTGLSLGFAPQYIRVHKNRLWAMAANSSRLYFSNAGDPTTFPANNYIDVNTNDGQVGTALAVTLDSLIVFKTDSIWVITGEPLGSGSTTVIGNLNLRRGNSDVGCVAFRTVQRVGSLLFFMARSGLYTFENYQSQLISEPANATFHADMNINFQSKSWGLYSPVEKKYLLGYADNSSTTPNKVLVFDTLINKFLIWDDHPGGWAVNFRFSQLDSVVMGDPNKGNLFQLFNGNADIAGANGILTSATSTTMVDSTASWTTNQFVDARVQVGLGTGSVMTGIVTANTGTTLTVGSWSDGTPTVGSVYTIGGFNSYWKSKIFDFAAPQMSKRYKYLNLFTDSEASYSLQVGASLDFAPLSFNLSPLSLSSGSTTWDQVGVTWDSVGIYYDSRTSLFKRSTLPGQGRFIQIMFGNFNANQPWRVFSYSISFKYKKARPT